MAHPVPDPLHIEAGHVATQYGIPPTLFQALIKQESGFRVHAHNASSDAGGLTQLIPSTAASLGVHDVYNPHQNLAGGARYLKQQFDRFKSWRLALAAYNAGPGNVSNGRWRQFAETRAYVDNILAAAGLHDQAAGKPASRPLTPSGRIPAVPPPIARAVQGAAGGDPLFGNDLVAKTAFDNLGRIARGTTPTFTLQDLVDAGNQPAPVTAAPAAPVAPVPAQNPDPVSPAHSQASSVTGAYKPGRVSIRAGANRVGMKLHQPVIDFVKQIAGVHGSEVTITTGTNHHQYVAGEGHTQSAHWTGWAADLALNNNPPGVISPAVTKLGQDALIAAGMPEAEARKQRGGVYNLNGYQVLFNTSVGGNHWNHVHIGLRPERQHG